MATYGCMNVDDMNALFERAVFSKDYTGSCVRG
jgi:hypothetical protein